MCIAGVIASIRAPKFDPLPDVGFDMFGYLPFPQLPNEVMLFIILTTFVRVVFHPLRVVILRRMLICHSAICLVRSVCVLATNLPDPLPRCNGFMLSSNIFVEAFHRLITGGTDVCGDVFFSGHIAICVLCAMIWHQYTVQIFYKIIIWVFVVLEAIFLLAMRWHYTIDLIIGFYLAIRIWDSYHSFNPIFSWLEGSPFLSIFNRQENFGKEVFTWLNQSPAKETRERFNTYIKTQNDHHEKISKKKEKSR